MAKRINTKPQKFKPVIKNPVRIPKQVITSWQETVTEFCRFPPDTKTKEEPIEKLVKLAIRFEKDNLKKTWKTFTQERGQLSSKLLTSKSMAQTYLLGFHLGNVARLTFLLKQATRFNGIVDAVNQFQKVELFDLGCGSGAMSIGYAQFLKQHMKRPFQMNVKLVDTSSTLLDISTTGLNKLNLQDLIIRKFRGGLETLDLSRNKQESKSLGIYTMGYVWNELATNKNAKKKIDQLFDRVIRDNQDAIVTVLEPANEDQARNAMILRDDMISKGFKVVYPCTHQGPCPLLMDDKDWCFSELGWDKPEAQKAVDKILKIDRQIMAVSGYMFVSPSLMKKGFAEKSDGKVIVGRPLESKKGNSPKIQYMLCDQNGIDKESVENQDNLLPRGYKFLKS